MVRVRVWVWVWVRVWGRVHLLDVGAHEPRALRVAQHAEEAHLG